VAGTIGASSNNGSGVAGINWNGLILPVRVLGRCGGVMSDIADGMRWAAGLDVPGVPANPNRAQVLNLSLGGPGPCSETESNAISAITAAGSTVVVAAGNSSSEAISFTPASCPGVITVAATDRNGSKAYYSNYGSVVEISAPGGDFSSYDSNGILSTLNSGLQSPATDKYAFYQGTSMAAPHVAGVTSLLYSLIPALTPTQAVQILQNTVTSFPLGSSCTTALCGRGIVNAGSAVGSLPRLTSLSPRSANPGSSLTLTVNGANFSSSARMVVNGVMRTTTFVNSSQLSAQLTPSDLVSKGAYSVTVSDTHPTYGSLTTDKLYLLVGLNRSTYLPLVRAKFQDQGGIHLGVIANGNFEAGSSGWTIYSNSGSTIIRSSFPAPVTPRSGSYAAWLGGRDYEASYLQQIVRVDPAAPFLIYYHWIESTDLCNYDYEYVRVDGFLVTQFTLCSFTKTNGWVRQSLDFSAYANKTIILHIDLINDDSYISSLYLDDFAFSATP
jgi:serine protease